MAIGFYDEDHNPLDPDTDIVRSFVDGHIGGIFEQVIYVANDNVEKYYTNIQVISQTFDSVWEEWNIPGWSLKLMYGERRPTEAEWDTVRSGEALSLPNLGSTTEPDISTFQPIWIRVFVPGGEAEQTRELQRLRLAYFIRSVGA